MNEVQIEEFTKKNLCSKENLQKLFSKRICKDIRKYTKKHAFPSWKRVNWKKRNGRRLNYFEQKFYDNIAFAISNFTLNEDCYVYRGFATTKDDLRARGILDENDNVVIGKAISFQGLISTSLDIKVAYFYAKNNFLKDKKKDIILIYKLKVNNKINALPIFNLSKVKLEQEILSYNLDAKINNSLKNGNYLEIEIETM